MMFRKEFSLLQVISALFSGQIMAEHKGHEFVGNAANLLI
ncbi:DUF2554 family protein [Enterobacter hormaechei subsp. xiangfangensis]